MKVAHLSEPAEEHVIFRDGLGVRERRVVGTGEVEEWFHLDPAFAGVEAALRDRVGRLTKFQHVKFARILSLEAARKDRGPILVSSHVPGTRLAEILEMAGHGLLTIDPGAGLQVVREVLGGLAVLHDSRTVAHGALGPERVVVTATGRVVMVEHVLAIALDRLQRPRHQLWREWRIPTPPAAGPVRLDMQTDLAQVGLLALAALLGRPIDDEEYPHRLRGLLPLAQDRLAHSKAKSIAPDVASWLERLVPVDSRRAFKSVREAQQALEALVAGGAAALGISASRVKEMVGAVPSTQAEPPVPSRDERPSTLPVAVVSPTSAPIADANTGDIDIAALLALEAELEGGSAITAPGAAFEPAAAPVEPVLPEPVVDPSVPEPMAAVDDVLAEDTKADVDALAAEAPFDEPAADVPPQSLPVELAEFVDVDLPASDEGDASAADLEGLARERELLAREFAQLVDAVAPADSLPVSLIPDVPVESEPLVDARVRWSSMPAESITDAFAVPVSELPAETGWSAPAREETIPSAPTAALDHVPSEWWREALPWRAEEGESRVSNDAVSVDPKVDGDIVDDATIEIEATVGGEAAIEDGATVEEGLTVGADVPVAVEVAIAHEATVVDDATIAIDATLEDDAAVWGETAVLSDAVSVDLKVDGYDGKVDGYDLKIDGYDGKVDGYDDDVKVDGYLSIEALEARAEAVVASAPEADVFALVSPSMDVAAEPIGDGDLVDDPAPVDEPRVFGPFLPLLLTPEPEAVGDALDEVSTGEPVDESATTAASALFAHAPGGEAAPDWRRGFLGLTVEPDEVVAVDAGADHVLPDTADATPTVALPTVAPPAHAQPADAVPEVVIVDDEVHGEAFEQLPSEEPEPVEASATEEATLVTAASKRKKKRNRRRKSAVPVPVLPTSVVEAAAEADEAIPAADVETGPSEAPPTLAVVRVDDEPIETVREPSSDAVSVAVRPDDEVPPTRTSSLLAREVPTWTPPVDFTPVRAQSPRPPVVEAVLPSPPPAAVPVPVPAPVTVVEPFRPLEQEIRAVGMPDLDDLTPHGGRSAVTSMADALGTMSPRSSAEHRSMPPVVVVEAPRRGRWRRVIAACLLIALFQGGAFAAWWWVQPGATGTLVVQTDRPGVEVLLDDTVVGRTPFEEAVAPGRHKLGLRQGTNVREMPVEISVGVVTTQTIRWPSERGGKGGLQITSNPAGAEVFLEGRSQGTTPLLLENLAAGDHQLTLRSEAGTVTTSALVLADATTPLEVKIFAGWVLVDAPIELQLLLNGREKIGSNMDGQILLPPGTHRLQAVNDRLGIRQWFTATVEPGAVKRVPFNVRPATLSLDEDAEIIVDGQSVGTTPGTVSITPGTHDIAIRLPDGSERRQALTVKSGQRVEF